MSALKVQVILELPRVRYDETELTEQLCAAAKQGFYHAAVQNIGHFRLARQTGFTVHGLFGLNVTNSLAALELSLLGAADITASFEMKFSEATHLRSPIPVGLILYGSLPLMIFRNCPLRARKGCSGCNGRFLTDRLGNRFPVQCDKEMAELYNYLPLVLSDKRNDTGFIDFGVLYFTGEDAKECAAVWKQYSMGEKPNGKFTRGLYYRGVE